MYELPELEVIRAFIAEKFAGATITKIQGNAKSIIGKKSVLCDELVSSTIWYVERRAGHLIFHLDTGKRLVLLLSEASSVYTGESGEKAAAGSDLILYIGERFIAFYALEENTVQLTSVRAVEEQLKVYAIDALDKRFTKSYLMNHLKKKRSSIKTFLIDGTTVSGIGAVYSDEILYAASIHPARKANSLSEPEAEQLFDAITLTLKEAIAHGGIRNTPLFAQDTLTGSYGDHLHVYGKAAQQTTGVGEEIELVTVARQKCFISPSKQLLQ